MNFLPRSRVRPGFTAFTTLLLAALSSTACDTDGVDGAAEVAGAVIGPDTLTQAQALGLDLAAALGRNDAHSAFGSLGAQVVTGPTLTNVNDFRAILCLPPQPPA